MTCRVKVQNLYYNFVKAYSSQETLKYTDVSRKITNFWISTKKIFTGVFIYSYTNHLSYFIKSNIERVFIIDYVTFQLEVKLSTPN